MLILILGNVAPCKLKKAVPAGGTAVVFGVKNLAAANAIKEAVCALFTAVVLGVKNLAAVPTALYQPANFATDTPPKNVKKLTGKATERNFALISRCFVPLKMLFYKL